MFHKDDGSGDDHDDDGITEEKKEGKILVTHPTWTCSLKCELGQPVYVCGFIKFTCTYKYYIGIYARRTLNIIS